jgi:hypothetical protein
MGRERVARGEDDDPVNNNALAVRNIARERNLAASTAQQLNRDGEKALEQGLPLSSAYIEGKKKLTNTADKIIVQQQTESERKENLMRIWAEKGRHVEDKFFVVCSQNFAASRYVVCSARSSLAFEKQQKDKS